MAKPVFTIITICYKRLAFLQEAVGAMLRQAYPHLEIIIVDNGAIPEVYNYIMDLEKKDGRVKIVHFKENQYRDDDPHYMNKVCLKAALDAASGDYVFYQSDDDIIADDYVEKMIKLFAENPQCTTAAGIVRDIDASGQLMEEGPRTTNFRPRYMPGHVLALSTLNPDHPLIMYSAPGCNITVKRQEFVEAGGFHPAIEFCMMWGIMPFGVTGFDETAVLYWRRHEGQLNKYMNMRGVTAFEVTMDLVKDWKLAQKWEVFGENISQYVIGRIVKTMTQNATEWLVISIYHFRFKASWALFKSFWFRPYFWRILPYCFWRNRNEFKYFLKPKFRRMFEAHPHLVEKLPCLLPLKERAFK